MGDKDKMQRELMSKLAELESRHKRRLSPDDIRYRLRMDTDKAQKDSLTSAMKALKANGGRLVLYSSETQAS